MAIYKCIYVDSNGFISKARDQHLNDPTALRVGEYDFGMDLPNSNSPKRLSPSAKTPQIGTEEKVVVDPQTGEETTIEVPIYAKWTDCKMVGQDVVVMTAEDIALRDSEESAEKIAKEHADQDAKPQKEKNIEKQFRDMGESIGLQFPLQDGEISSLVPQLLAQVTALRDANKDKEANAISDKVLGLLAYWITLGDDVTAPFLGDGANN